MSPLISFLKSPKLTETTCRDGTCSVRLWEPCWILLWAFGSLQLFTDTQQFTLTSEQGRHAREIETGGKEMSNSLFSEIPSDNLIFPFPSLWWLFLPFPVLSVWFQIKLSIYFFFLFNLPCLYLVLLIQRLCSPEGGPGWLTFKGKGRFCRLFLQDQTWFWSNVARLMWNYGLENVLSEGANERGRQLLCWLLCSCPPCLGLLTWSLTRGALRAHSGLDTVCAEQNSSVWGWEEGKRELKW